jgi:hypothetical protein
MFNLSDYISNVEVFAGNCAIYLCLSVRVGGEVNWLDRRKFNEKLQTWLSLDTNKCYN